MQSEANEKYPDDESMIISRDASSTATMSFFPSERVRMLTASERMISVTATDADIAHRQNARRIAGIFRRFDTARAAREITSKSESGKKSGYREDTVIPGSDANDEERESTAEASAEHSFPNRLAAEGNGSSSENGTSRYISSVTSGMKSVFASGAANEMY